MALIHLNLNSRYLQGNTDVSIILPEAPEQEDLEEYYSQKKKYKVLWLLHGTFGDYSDWVRKTGVELYAAERNIAVVMPSAGNGNYVDWGSFAMGYDVYSYFLHELMPFIYASFPISKRRQDNFIAGLSMGGKGAFLFALNEPSLFAKAYSFSSCPKPLRKPDPKDFSYVRDMNLIKNFGGMEGYRKSPLNLWDLSKKAVEEKIPLPDLYFACGDIDKIAYEPFLKFRKYAEEISFPAKFYEIAGYDHEWRFWDMCLRDCLARFFPKKGEVPLFEDLQKK